METARVLAHRGARVIMAVRDIDAGAKVKDLILSEVPTAEIIVLQLDVSSLESVHAFCESFMAMNLPINILIINAGIMGGPFKLTKDGVELQFATNYLGHFLLTKRLLPTIIDTAKNSGIEGRIINVSSSAHFFAGIGGFDLTKFEDENRYMPYIHYGKTKLAMILHTNELSRRLKQEGVNVTANSVNPGIVVTRLLRYYNVLEVIAPFFEGLLSWIIFKSVPQGAATQCFMAIHPKVAGVSGKYFQNCSFAKRSPLASDAMLSRKFWESTELLLENLCEKYHSY
ncbi:hypothetical protein KP509_22G021900 [Ceratopteris richardii]|nr:hypothetical protein KP509_22G021900 [Ceratopteris richardii]